MLIQTADINFVMEQTGPLYEKAYEAIFLEPY